MAVRPILRYPDPGLALPATPVTLFDASLADLAADLFDTMRAAPGIGITGPHIGVLSAITVIQIDAGQAARVYVNPQVAECSDDLQTHAEGSVSMPGFSEEVARPRSVTISYQMLDGRWRQEDADGLLAVCLQHEIDQLNGIFWLQKLSRLKRDRLVKRYRKSLERG